MAADKKQMREGLKRGWALLIVKPEGKSGNAEK